MNKTVKNVLIIVGISMFASVAISYAFYVFVVAPLLINKLDAEKEFRKNEALIVTAKDYFAGLEYDKILIYPDGRIVGYLDSGHDLIDDEETVNTVKQLRRRGYAGVSKRNNCVVFRRWRHPIFPISKGIAYSIDGRVPDDSAIQFLIHIEPLTEDGWYYYEKDYNEYRARNR